MAKRKTLEQVEAMQAKAVQFLRDIAHDEDRAAEFEAMTPEEYAEHKGVEIVEGNPIVTITVTRGDSMATKRELEERVQELEEENEELQDRLDQVADLVVPEEDEIADEDEADDGNETEGYPEDEEVN